MGEEFIQPNWHIILLHYPLALLGMGVTIELLSFFWRKSSVRHAGRWMILIGALSCIPTLTMGLYAFRDVIAPGPGNDESWRELSARSPWTSEQWEAMSHHIWYTAGGTILALLAAFVWLSCSDTGRRRLYWPSLLLMVGALGVLDAGAWYAGEAVFKHSVAVQGTSSRNPSPESAIQNRSAVEGSLPPQTAASSRPTSQRSVSDIVATIRRETHRAEVGKGMDRKGIEYYVPPLQLHLLLAGIAVAIALGAIGVTFRRWSVLREAAVSGAPVELPEHRLRADVPSRSLPPQDPAPGMLFVPAIFPARLWLWALIFALGTAASGLWMTGDWQLKVLTEPMHNRFALDQTQRLFEHMAFGLSIALLLLVGAVLTRLAKRHRPLTVFVILLLLIAVGGQAWLGILLLFDSSSGSVTKFN